MARNSKVIIARDIKIDRDYKNVLTYSESDMLSLCQTNQVYSNSTYEFLKENESPMYVGCDYQTALKGNYIAFQNPNYSNKWFFAFIDRVEYNSETSTMIYFTIDVFSTWFDYWNKLPCMVMREHTNDDTIGANTIDEGLAVPDVIGNYETGTNFIDNELYICVATNWDISGNYTSTSYTPPGGQVTTINVVKPTDGLGYNGVSAFNNCVFGQLLCMFPFTQDGLYSLGHFIDITNRQGHIEDLHDMFIVSSCIFTSGTDLVTKSITLLKEGDTLIESNFITTSYKELQYSSSNAFNVYFRNVSFEKPLSIIGYTPKNNKCKVFPFNYIRVTNNIGVQNIYKIEDFSPVPNFPLNEIVFQVQMALSIGMSCRIVPCNYKNVAFNNDESIPLAKFPTCSWSADSYTNWLTDNSVNGNKSVTTAAALGLAAVTGNLTGALISTAGQFISQYGQFKKAQLLPEITGGTNTGDVNFSNGDNEFNIKQFHLKPEMMKQVDDYFSKFGYKTMQIKSPNITGRTNWNYVQIGNDEIVGVSNYHNSISVPTSDMEKINQIFRTGVTCWHNHANVGDFSVTNTIVQ